MLKVQTYLRDLYNQGGTQQACLDILTAELGIKAKVYEEEGIVLLDYNQIDSPKTDPIVIECRSLILTLDNFEVVSRKFDRFFNYGEALEYYGDFDFSQAQIFEKADGSLIGVYFWDDKWHISTRGMAFAEGEHHLGGTFKDKVLEAFGLTEEEFQEKFSKLTWDTTFIFEYTSPENRIVTKYEKPEMVLLGASFPHDEETPLYEDVSFELYRVGIKHRKAKTYAASSLEEVVELANSLPNLQEGFVLYDPSSGKRMKIKSSLYVVAHTMRGNDPLPSKKNLLTLLFTGELEEFLVYFPEWEGKAKEVFDEVFTKELETNCAWWRYESIEDQKQFALAVKNVPNSFLLFQARKVKSTPWDVFKGLDLSKKLKMFLD